MWTCNCGSQKYNAYHICKHLVQAVPRVPASFFHQVVRRRTKPLYRHPALCSSTISNSPNPAMLPDGSITDGDDHIWTGDKKVLEGGGGWRDLERKADVILGKRRHNDLEVPVALAGVSTAADSLSDAGTEISDAISYASDQEETELDELTEIVAKGATYLREAAARLDAQIPHKNKLWMKNVAESGWLKGVERFVNDTNRVESTGRARDTTWPRNAAEAKRSRNVMGYQARYRSTSSTPAIFDEDL
ncbi:hypothetical protein BJ138DRAFT_1019167 [Hygrophoropsis aurantiaca]|uniref:Uncharacterized protein n=1 Tax=Hygrophoropsis aurantiaca TaxID=72124 RepID=A0ACB7ZUE4_9AGAM|nr:hypothetical protein BJ138DRAFT_1019167 [Hygrophoropsis aurantiaca]